MERLYFIALLPPSDIAEEVTRCKQQFADRHNAVHALRSPPHITLYPPFRYPEENIGIVENSLTEFGRDRASFTVRLRGFGAFPPRVIYVNVIKTPELMGIREELVYFLGDRLQIRDSRDEGRSFSPHMTVAFKDLSKKAFKVAWPEFEARSFQRDFTVDRLTLLEHHSGRWHILRDFPFRI